MTRDEMLSAIDALRAGVVALGPAPARPEPAHDPDPVRVAARSLLVEVLTHRATITLVSSLLGALATWVAMRTGAP